ncbi:unnamed protein product [Chrysodeixis includens]|uniref:Uncharacterized protein n=1 Tax=Chrysodeixis includens TaxID=689277 RepID=A0A9N8L3X0_CHRIL|nr:unnamed protein product [Chrysodeixis includens]
MFDYQINSERDGAYAVPHYQKLRVRVIHIRDNRKGQPARSAMGRPRPGRTAFMITVFPTPGKYEFTTAAWGSHSTAENLNTAIQKRDVTSTAPSVELYGTRASVISLISRKMALPKKLT